MAMFSFCGNLNYVKCLATNISALFAKLNWLQEVASSGTFISQKSMFKQLSIDFFVFVRYFYTFAKN